MNYEKCMKAVSNLAIVSVDKPLITCSTESVKKKRYLGTGGFVFVMISQS